MWGYPYYRYGGINRGYGYGGGNRFGNNIFNWGFNPYFQINIFYPRRRFYRRPF